MSDMNLLTVKQVSEKLTCSSSYVWKLLRVDPTFPKPIQLGLGESRPRSTRWVDSAITDWLMTKHASANTKTDGVLTNGNSNGKHRGLGGELHQAT